MNYFLAVSMVISCKKEHVPKPVISMHPKTILIQPFKGIASVHVDEIASAIREIYPEIKVLKAIDFPTNSYYAPRNRYRADSIIKYLSSMAPENTIILGLTTKDISATKGSNPDFGIIGLGFRPGNACVASSFRLRNGNKNEQFSKVAIHELGHTQGLPHCREKTCFMRDAEGGNPTDEEKDFCKKCKEFLKTKNWNFN
ncbi:hypothetical protein ACM44_11405 [Chryseobacterium koreense CCUG 49689]|uniref:Zn-dependent protease n=1 Tax=Chryseobacterium koreense CCUG 49689 TaxID=1304281 RepID=A0A0J7LNF4_9FLAO|nr:hypothetical protein ACM44_11405 [Chryseobacterium koreense CCUG 49689]